MNELRMVVKRLAFIRAASGHPSSQRLRTKKQTFWSS